MIPNIYLSDKKISWRLGYAINIVNKTFRSSFEENAVTVKALVMN